MTGHSIPRAIPAWALSSGQLVCGRRVIPYTMHLSRRARSLRLSIAPGTGLVVTVPAEAACELVDPFLRRHQRWILRQADRLARVASRIPKRWPYGPTLPYRGEERIIRVEAAGGQAMVGRSPEGALIVRMPRPGIEGARRLLKRWFMDEARRWLTARTEALAAVAGLSYRWMSVRDQRRRWGSCSAQGNLNFNYRLVMAPPAVMDDVVLHELLHRLELNHSPRFWALMAKHSPTHRDSMAWLNTYGPYLSV